MLNVVVVVGVVDKRYMVAEKNKKTEGILIDERGFEYMVKVPDGWRLATIDDFHSNGKRNIGMPFLIQWVDNPEYYEYREMTSDVTREYLLPFIEDKRVFI